MRVIVVGAGFAGLAAAWDLERAGVEVIILEARERVGGRVWSRELGDGAVVEMGAEFILPGDMTIRTVATSLGLELFDKGATYGDREPRGGAPVSRDELLAGYAEVAAAARDGRLGSGSVVDALAALPMTEGARAAIQARIEVSTAYGAEDQSAAVLSEGGTAVGGYATHSVAGGNQRIALEIARRIGGVVRVGTPVEQIVWAADRPARVRAWAGGESVDADAAVIAVPASVIDRIAFDPPLPAAKAAALAAVRYGQAAKLFLPLEVPAAPSATLSVPDRYWTFTQHAPGGSPLLVAGSFAGSPPAMERLATADGPDRWVDGVRALRPDLQMRANHAALSTWSDDPWIRGAYSARSMTSPMDDAALAAPVPPLHFAGEHTAGAKHALMEGALASGLRAASEILAARGTMRATRP
ncbi:MAG TPA: NAD(P)/FAD-dependent oxidoreductase [Candidatus Limnocylindrales bacterium]|nr:NAD(P)/FAD-dependent oxidoreductase [Candidatus Limnocylindrales bacterium]